MFFVYFFKILAGYIFFLMGVGGCGTFAGGIFMLMVLYTLAEIGIFLLFGWSGRLRYCCFRFFIIS